MEQENEQAQEEVVEQEEQTSEETVETTEQEEETVTLSKSEITKLKRKAMAYDAEKKKTSDKPKQESDSKYIDTVFMVKDLNQEEYESLRDEAEELGIPLERYLGSQSGKTVLSKIRQQKKSKDASEALTSKAPIVKGFTNEDIKKMSSKELEKILPR